MSIKILQICAVDHSFETLLKPLIKEQLKNEYISHNACSNTGNLSNLRDEGFEMFDISIDRQIKPISNLKSIYNLYKLMKHEKYDIVHVHTPIAALLGRIAAKLAGVKNIIYTAHGFYFHEGMTKIKYNIFYFIEKFFCKFFTDWLLLQSIEDYQLCIEKNFNTKKRTIHLSNGVDINNEFNPVKINKESIIKLKNTFNIQEKDVVFIFVGRLVKEKGIIELIEAFTKLNSNMTNTKLLLVGDVLASERDQDIKGVLKSIKANKSIIHTGFRKDINNLMYLSDVFVLPSYREGLPRSIIEAMALNKPVIATNIRGCREEVIHNYNGFLIEKMNSNHLYEKMRILTNDKDLRHRFGMNGRIKVEESFNEEKILKIQMDLFQSITKDKENFYDK
jgi:glycosyltransferase involved in cell wall biosynthesis